MSIVILSIVESIGKSQSSIIDHCKGLIPLRSKELVYRDILGIDSADLPNISFIEFNNGRPYNVDLCTPHVIKCIDWYNPNIYISCIGDQKLEFIKSKLKLVILYDMVNRQIICNGTVDVTFSDVGIDGSAENIGDEFYIETDKNGYYPKDGHLEKNTTLARAFANVTKRLIIEFIRNPANLAIKKDDKAELLEIVNQQKSLIAKIGNKLDELENRIRNM